MGNTGIARYIVAGIFAVGAIVLAWHGKEGWGWCVVAAIVISSGE